jgi:hypothetical protein
MKSMVIPILQTKKLRILRFCNIFSSCGYGVDESEVKPYYIWLPHLQTCSFKLNQMSSLDYIKREKSSTFQDLCYS